MEESRAPAAPHSCIRRPPAGGRRKMSACGCVHLRGPPENPALVRFMVSSQSPNLRRNVSTTGLNEVCSARCIIAPTPNILLHGASGQTRASYAVIPVSCPPRNRAAQAPVALSCHLRFLPGASEPVVPTGRIPFPPPPSSKSWLTPFAEISTISWRPTQPAVCRP